MTKLIGSNKTTGSLYEKGLRELNPKALTMLSTIEVLMENSAEIHATEKISLNDQKALVAMLNLETLQTKKAHL